MVRPAGVHFVHAIKFLPEDMFGVDLHASDMKTCEDHVLRGEQAECCKFALVLVLNRILMELSCRWFVLVMLLLSVKNVLMHLQASERRERERDSANIACDVTDFFSTQTLLCWSSLSSSIPRRFINNSSKITRAVILSTSQALQPQRS